MLTKLNEISNSVAANPLVDKEKSSTEANTEQAWKAAKKFEAYYMGFVYQKGMDSIPKSEDFGNSVNQEVYQNFFSQAISDQVEKSPHGIGLAEMIVKGKKPMTPSLTQDFKPLAAPVLNNPEFYLPAARVTSGFGFRGDPLEGDQRFHQGMDLAYPKRTPIQAAAEGKVVFSGKKGGYGNAVMIQHDQGYTSLYGHADENLVKVGARVKKGEVIAYSGSTGRSTGPHLHFEIRKDGKAVDPKKLVFFKNNT
ncbi:MAG: peptidoglycan DD-metalloendopeptidase family protein [Deltaproteobacteria bacterium]|nr:peptidoglycan DD-metalloendopeptidase family protein [Deltaproteobacteria bacterium]